MRKLPLKYKDELVLCRVCGTYKEHSEFHKDSSRRDGLHARCKVCRRELISQEKRKAYIRKYYSARHKRLRRTSLEFKLKENLRTRFRKALKNNTKAGSFIKSLGCSIEQFKAYIESKFQTGMSWDNYGIHGWHIDHIKPLASFDLQDPEQFSQACHYTNLQPLWSKENWSKGNKVGSVVY